jgi:hypothetical protein
MDRLSPLPSPKLGAGRGPATLKRSTPGRIRVPSHRNKRPISGFISGAASPAHNSEGTARSKARAVPFSSSDRRSDHPRSLLMQREANSPDGQSSTRQGIARRPPSLLRKKVERRQHQRRVAAASAKAGDHPERAHRPSDAKGFMSCCPCSKGRAASLNPGRG